MEPISIIGLLTTAGTLASTITVTIKGLSDIRNQFKDAEVRIRLLIGELSTVKSALTQINDWTHYLDDTHRQAEVVDGLKVSLDGCQLALGALADEVRSLLGHSTPGSELLSGYRTRVRYAWNESSLKEHQSRLHAQTAALQLLLQAVQLGSNSRPEQEEFLRRPESRQIIRRVADDTSTLRATVSQHTSQTTPSIVSRGDSTIDEKIFAWDDEIVNAETYRRAMMHARSKSEMVVKSTEREGNFDTSSAIETEESSEQLSSTEIPDLSYSHKSPPYEMSVVSEPLCSDNDQIVISNTPISDGNSTRRSILSYRSRHAEVDKKSFWSKVSGRRSSRTVAPSAHSAMTGSNYLKTPTPGSRRGRRGFENSYHTSIDFGSEEGLSAPPIVRAAQAGSVVEVEKLLDQRADINARHAQSGRNALSVASHCGNEEVVRLLLQHGALVNECDASSLSALHLASLRGHVEVVESLLLEHADIDIKGPSDQTPLHFASEKNQVDVAEVLLRKRAKVNARGRDQMTPLHVAAKHGDEAMTGLLVSHGADIEAKDSNFMGAIHYACQGGHSGVVGVLLNKKANIEAPGKASMTPLICASSAGKVHVAELLLRKKASLKHKGEGEMNALHWASYNGHVEVVDLLLQRKALISVTNKDGRTPLHLAVMAGEFAVTDLLLRKGAAVESQCKSMLKPVHYACTRSSLEITRLLLGYNAHTEAEDSLRNRPLHLACTRGSTPHVELLLQKGVSADARNANGDRPLCLASSLGHVHIVRMLLDRGAAVRSKFTKGPSHEDSPLCLASKSGHTQVVQELLSRGASVLQKDERNWQPLRYAAFNAHPEVVELLLKHGATLSGSASGGWGFNITAQRIGFANDVSIEEQRKGKVLRLLTNAEAREQRTQENSASAVTSLSSPAVQNQTTPMELPDPGIIRSPVLSPGEAPPPLPPRATPEMSSETPQLPDDTITSKPTVAYPTALPALHQAGGPSAPIQGNHSNFYPTSPQYIGGFNIPGPSNQSYAALTHLGQNNAMAGHWTYTPNPMTSAASTQSNIPATYTFVPKTMDPPTPAYSPHPAMQHQTTSLDHVLPSSVQGSPIVTLGPDGMWQRSPDPAVQRAPPRDGSNPAATTPTIYPLGLYEMPS